MITAPAYLGLRATDRSNFFGLYNRMLYCCYPLLGLRVLSAGSEGGGGGAGALLGAVCPTASSLCPYPSCLSFLIFPLWGGYSIRPHIASANHISSITGIALTDGGRPPRRLRSRYSLPLPFPARYFVFKIPMPPIRAWGIQRAVATSAARRAGVRARTAKLGTPAIAQETHPWRARRRALGEALARIPRAGETTEKPLRGLRKYKYWRSFGTLEKTREAGKSGE